MLYTVCNTIYSVYVLVGDKEIRGRRSLIVRGGSALVNEIELLFLNSTDFYS